MFDQASYLLVSLSHTKSPALAFFRMINGQGRNMSRRVLGGSGTRAVTLNAKSP